MRRLVLLIAVVLALGLETAPGQASPAPGDSTVGKAARHYGTAMNFHGAKVQACRIRRYGQTVTYWRLDTRKANRRARAKVPFYYHGELSGTNFSHNFPRYQRVGRVQDFNGMFTFPKAGSTLMQPIIQLKGGAKRKHARVLVTTLRHC